LYGYRLKLTANNGKHAVHAQPGYEIILMHTTVAIISLLN